MKVKIMSLMMVAGLVLGGCQGNTNKEGMTDRDDTNFEPTRYSDDDRANRIDNRNPNNRTNEINQDDRSNNPNPSQINNRNQDTNDQYDVSEEAADKITDEIDEIDYAYVLTTKNNAYVAAVLDNDQKDNRKNTADKGRKDTKRDRDKDVKTRNISNENDDSNHTGGELTDEVKEEISKIVQSVDNKIDNVYVTTNPDFADLTTDYVDQMNNGKPIRGFFDQIGNMVERVFPQDKK